MVVFDGGSFFATNVLPMSAHFTLPSRSEGVPNAAAAPRQTATSKTVTSVAFM